VACKDFDYKQGHNYCFFQLVKMPLHILHLEDDLMDASLVEALLLGESVQCKITVVCGRREFLAGLENEKLDLILSDFSMPRFDGLSALDLAQEKRPEIPFIFLSGALGEDLAVSALKEGATDYLIKDRMSRLPAAIERAMQRADEFVQRRKMEEKLLKSETRFQRLLNHTPAVIYSLKVEGENAALDFISGNITKFFGFTIDECLKPGWWPEHLHLEDTKTALALRPSLMAHGTALAEYRFRHKDGSFRWVQDAARLVHDPEGTPVEIVGAWTDITESRRTLVELIEAAKSGVALPVAVSA
jgi:PAS domain S-box-containing protein